MGKHIKHLVIEQLQISDYQELLSAMKAAYLGWQGSYWSMQAITRLIDQFSEGQFVVKADGKVPGAHT